MWYWLAETLIVAKKQDQYWVKQLQFMPAMLPLQPQLKKQLNDAYTPLVILMDYTMLQAVVAENLVMVRYMN